jgi:hypothetical protein
MLVGEEARPDRQPQKNHLLVRAEKAARTPPSRRNSNAVADAGALTFWRTPGPARPAGGRERPSVSWGHHPHRHELWNYDQLRANDVAGRRCFAYNPELG